MKISSQLQQCTFNTVKIETLGLLRAYQNIFEGIIFQPLLTLKKTALFWKSKLSINKNSSNADIIAEIF